MQKILHAALISALILGFFDTFRGDVWASPLPANLFSPSEIIGLVNQLRAANGLQPYRVNNALMAAAQAHSEYQAASGNASHTGKGGSRPHDRAVAYGYGGGAAVSVSENIYSGSNASAAQAVGWWQGDSLHLGTMLSSSYRDAGAGMAQANGVNYYTLVVGYVTGEKGQPPAGQPPSGQPGSDRSPSNPPAGKPGANPAPAGTPVALIAPIQVATPRADGSIIHEVQWGHFLYNIAEAYQVELPYLLVLNSLKADTVIYPGDKLLIRPANPTPTPAASPTLAPTKLPPATSTPAGFEEGQSHGFTSEIPNISSTVNGFQDAGSPVAIAEASAPAEIANAESDQSGADAGVPRTERKGLDPLLLFIGGFVVLGTALLVFGSLLNRRV